MGRCSHNLHTVRFTGIRRERPALQRRDESTDFQMSAAGEPLVFQQKSLGAVPRTPRALGTGIDGTAFFTGPRRFIDALSNKSAGGRTYSSKEARYRMEIAYPHAISMRASLQSTQSCSDAVWLFSVLVFHFPIAHTRYILPLTSRGRRREIGA